MVRLILFLVLSVMAAEGTSLAENASTCPVDAVPVQILSRWEDGPVTTLSGARMPDYQLYNTFIATVTKHLAAKLAQENLCPNKPGIWGYSSIKSRIYLPQFQKTALSGLHCRRFRCGPPASAVYPAPGLTWPLGGIRFQRFAPLSALTSAKYWPIRP